MECPRCGAEFASRAQPCVFCGEPYRAQIRRSLSLPGARIAQVGAALLVLVLFTQFMAVALYSPVNLVHDAELNRANRALIDGQTVKAREILAPMHRWKWFSGIPGALVGASYYQQHLNGDEEALESMGGWVEDAYDREGCFLTRYYYALYLYEKGDYEKAIPILQDAAKEMTGVTMWADAISRSKWQRAIGELTRACKAASKGEPKPSPAIEVRLYI